MPLTAHREPANHSARDAVTTQNVRGAIAVVVNSAIKRSRSVAAEASLDQGAAARVLVDKSRDVVDESTDDHQLPRLALGFEVVPRKDGQVVRVLRPLDLLGLARDRLELHRELAAADLVVRERLELRSEAEQRLCANVKLCRVSLIDPCRIR